MLNHQQSSLIYCLFGSLISSSSVPTERNTIAKERAAGMYRLSAYYTAKLASEIPVVLAQPMLLYTITYWTIGLNRSPLFLVGVLVIVTATLLAFVRKILNINTQYRNVVYVKLLWRRVIVMIWNLDGIATPLQNC